MSRLRGASARSPVALLEPCALIRRLCALGSALVVAAAVAVAVSLSSAAAAGTCDRSATPSTLASQISAATSGQTICLASGSYGTWSGTNKQITLRADDGATPTMRVSLGAGDSGFTLDGLSGMGGSVAGGAHDFTIRNSSFDASFDVQGTPGANIVLDGNKHDWPAVFSGGANAKL